jgi:sugar/nucleoside kinase (ribokinase family)
MNPHGNYFLQIIPPVKLRGWQVAMDRVISIGIHIVDILGRPVTGIPEGQNLSLLDEIRITVAGSAAGTSVDLAKLGVPVIAVGAIGKDTLGDFVIDTMSRYGINVDNLVRKDGVQTSATMLPIRPNGERPALHVTGANGELTLDDVNFEVFRSAKVLHMGGTSLLPKLDGEPTREVLKQAKESGLITTFDLVAVQRPDLLDLVEPCLPFVDYFMPGLEEAEMMTGLHDRMEIISFFLDRGAGHTVFKMGARGSSIAHRSGTGRIEEIRLPAFQTEVVDTTGCGDAYCAGFIVGLIEGRDLRECGMLGTAAGSLVATGLGSDAGVKDLQSTIEYMKGARRLPLSDV